MPWCENAADKRQHLALLFPSPLAPGWTTEVGLVYPDRWLSTGRPNLSGQGQNSGRAQMPRKAQESYPHMLWHWLRQGKPHCRRKTRRNEKSCWGYSWERTSKVYRAQGSLPCSHSFVWETEIIGRQFKRGPGQNFRSPTAKRELQDRMAENWHCLSIWRYPA